jgi:hypothetical protein
MIRKMFARTHTALRESSGSPAVPILSVSEGWWVGFHTVKSKVVLMEAKPGDPPCEVCRGTGQLKWVTGERAAYCGCQFGLDYHPTERPRMDA